MNQPSTSDLMEKVRQIEIRSRRIVRNRTAGAWQASFKGRGIEFAEVREFYPGDDIRSIDWNVSAKLASPYVKLFTEEREQNIFLLVDRSASGQFGSTKISKAERIAEVAAVLAYSATLSKDRVGLLLFSDRAELHLRPNRGHRHVLRIIRELLAFSPQSKQTDLAAGMQWLLQAQLRRSIVFVLSDLMTDDFQLPLRQLCSAHEVIVMHVTDPLEQALPDLAPLSVVDLETGVTARLSRRKMKRQSNRAAKARAEAETMCRRAGAEFVSIDTDRDYVPTLIKLFQRRGSRR